MNRNLSELLWADLGNELSLSVCANIAELCTKQCRPLPYWLRSAIQSSPASDRLFKAEMDRRGWKRYLVMSLDEYWRTKSAGAFSDCEMLVRVGPNDVVNDDLSLQA